MQLKFDPQQDRLLLRVNSLDKQQLRFWLTRRIVKRLLPPLIDLLQKSVAGDRSGDAKTAAALFEFEQQTVRDHVDFVSEFDDDATSLPLGEDGLLIETVSLTTHEGGDVSVKLANNSNTSATLRLNEKLLHSLFAILRQALAVADWDLPSTAASASSMAIDIHKPSVIH
ncbi:MAG: hypothetical protein H6981_07950 [Gammaproteobacteria bacterium]|nr:hypothetical protein [Gammaproteobacteria bacterium]MCP5136717.1 hypothetical protein [Gammaproteobacteria bacterium]